MDERVEIKTESGWVVVLAGRGPCPVMIGRGKEIIDAVEALRSTPVLSLSGGGCQRAIAWAKRHGVL